MLRILPPYYSNSGKRLIKTPKVYLRDHGILNALLRIISYEDLLSHPIFGSSWEGLVIDNLIAISPHWTHSFYRTSAGAEMDLVLTFGEKIIAVECKASKTPYLTRGFWNAIEDIKPNETWIVAPISEEYPLKRNVFVLPLLTAMNKLNSLTNSYK